MQCIVLFIHSHAISYRHFHCKLVSKINGRLTSHFTLPHPHLHLIPPLPHLTPSPPHTPPPLPAHPYFNPISLDLSPSLPHHTSPNPSPSTPLPHHHLTSPHLTTSHPTPSPIASLPHLTPSGLHHHPRKGRWIYGVFGCSLPYISYILIFVYNFGLRLLISQEEHIWKYLRLWLCCNICWWVAKNWQLACFRLSRLSHWNKTNK